jgi:hypothetical protein
MASTDLPLVEELYLLLTNDAGRREGFGTQRAMGLAAAALGDLIAARRIEVSGGSDPRVRVVDPEPTGCAVLDPVLAALVAHDGRRLSALVRDREVQGEHRVADDLVERGILDKRTGPAGLFPTHPTIDAGPERLVRARLRDHLRTARGSARDATVLAILLALGVERTVLGPELPELGRRELRDRITALTAGSSVGSGLEQAMRTLTAAIAATGSIGAIASGG